MPRAGSAFRLTERQFARLQAIIQSEYAAFGWQLPLSQLDILATSVARTCAGMNGYYSEAGARRVARTWAWLRADVFPGDPLIAYTQAVIERERRTWKLSALATHDMRRMALDSLYFTYIHKGSYSLNDVWENARAFARGVTPGR
ncbi:MAG TPA: hypothetical protein VH599_12565 [Ktedonobacterales bacterium]|jgi:hypothetical protein